MRSCLAIVGLVAAAIAIAMVIAFVRPNSSSPLPGEEEPKTQAETPPPAKLMTFEEASPGAVKMTIDIQDRGAIVAEVYPKAAPRTVAHLKDLIKQHFYDGMLVHRVEGGSFRIFQTGDPLTRNMNPKMLAGKTPQQIGEQLHVGMGGSGTTVPLEAHLPNVAKSLGLARSQSLDSGDSQFYVNVGDNHSLDGQYCVFGRIVQGQDVAQRVQVGDRVTRVTMQ